MKTLFDGYNYIIRLDRGERLAKSLQQFCAASDVEIIGASVSGVGAAEGIELGYYDLDAQTYAWQTFDGLYEMTGLQGTIAQGERGEYILHLHGTFSDQDYRVIGGHIKDFIVGGTCELFVHMTYRPLRRRHDEQTGLNLLDL